MTGIFILNTSISFPEYSVWHFLQVASLKEPGASIIKSSGIPATEEQILNLLLINEALQL